MVLLLPLVGPTGGTTGTVGTVGPGCTGGTVGTVGTGSPGGTVLAVLFHLRSVLSHLLSAMTSVCLQPVTT